MEDRKYPLGKFMFMLFFVLMLIPVVIISLSGNILWIEGWIVSAWFDVMILANMVYMYVKNPDLISERLNAHGTHNQKKWDRYLLRVLFLVSAIWIVGMPLDAQMLHISPPFPLYMKIVGSILLVPALFLMIKATMDNPYLSTVVRIQSDRKQETISTGMYGIVRHPQYLGIVLTSIGCPLLLGSIVGIGFGMVMVIIIVIRINGEEAMLVEELEGYDEYREKVKYRLFPLVW